MGKLKEKLLFGVAVLVVGYTSNNILHQFAVNYAQKELAKQYYGPNLRNQWQEFHDEHREKMWNPSTAIPLEFFYGRSVPISIDAEGNIPLERIMVDVDSLGNVDAYIYEAKPEPRVIKS